MTIHFHKYFQKAYKKLPAKIRDTYLDRLKQFKENPFHPELNNHSVGIAYPGCRSIKVTGDYRALYEKRENDIVVFVRIGTHAELYRSGNKKARAGEPAAPE